MGTVKLKNGKIEEEMNVKVVMMSLQQVFNEKTDDIMRFGAVDVVMACRDKSYHMSEEMQGVLGRVGLMKNGTMHEITRNVILSCFEQDGLSMVSPIEGDDQRNFGYNTLSPL